MKSAEATQQSVVNAEGNEPAPSGDQPGKVDRSKSREIGGPPGPEPTRYGDWQYNGRCTDF